MWLARTSGRKTPSRFQSSTKTSARHSWSLPLISSPSIVVLSKIHRPLDDFRLNKPVLVSTEMSKTKKYIYAFLMAFGCTIVLFFAVGGMLSPKWMVERSLMINAPAEKIYPYLANLKTGWPQWSAFDFEDPAIQYTYSGSDEGVGAERSWISKKMGDGSQKITKADPKNGIEFELTMKGNPIPIQGRITLATLSNGTLVTWHDEGDMGENILFRYLAKFMDKFMGKAFEKSLQTLKEKTEK